MEGLSLLLERHSCGRLVAPAPQGQALENILQAALAVPDHGGLHPWQFILCEGDGRLRLGQILAEAAQRRGEGIEAIDKLRQAPLRAPLVVVVVSRAIVHPKVPVLEQQLSAGCAAMAMQMAAQAQGFGGIWRSGWVMFDPGVHQALGLTDGEQIVGFVYLGTPEVPVSGPRRALDSAKFVRYL